MKLTVVRGPGEGLVFALQPGRQVAGREMSCAVRVPSTRVSRRHCAFLVQGRRCVVQDLDSSNGVLINGHPMPMCELLDGTYVQIGDVLLRFDGPAPEEVQAPLQSKVLEERESFDPDDPDLKPTTVAPAPREILALRSMSMSQLFRGGDEETNLEEGETTAASIQFEGADELPPEAMRAAKPTAPKAEAPKPAPPKVEPPKPAPPKVEAPKAEAPKPTSPPASPPASPPPGRKVATVKEAPSPAATPTKPKRAAKTPAAAPPSPAEEGQSPLDLRFWLIVAAVLMTSSVLGLSAGLWLLWSRG